MKPAKIATVIFVAASYLNVGPVVGQEAWPPSIPKLHFTRPAASSHSARHLDGFVLEPGLSLLTVNDTNGLGAEAAGVDSWRQGRQKIFLFRRSGGWFLSDGVGNKLALSDELGATFRNMNQYFATMANARSRPITREELKAALLSARGVAGIRLLFERMIKERLVFNGKTVIPEIQGEATLGTAGLIFNRVVNPVTPLLKRLNEFRLDPKALAELYQHERKTMQVLDPQGRFLKFLSETLPAWEARDFPPKERRAATLGVHIDTILELADGLSTGEQRTNLEAMTRHGWVGRHVGIWHTHPHIMGPTAGSISPRS